MEIRDDVPDKDCKADLLGWFSVEDSSAFLSLASGLEAGRFAARDIGGSDPEKMAPPKVMQYVQSMFADSSVSVSVVEGQQTFEEEYPLLAAVNRAVRSK